MNQAWFTLILLGFAASFMPLQFGLEIVLLGTRDGLKKCAGLISGINLFRILLLSGLAFIFTGFIARIGDLLAGVSDVLKRVLNQLGLDITSGQHVIFDVLLIAAGVMLWIQIVRHLRNRGQPKQPPKSDPSTAKHEAYSPTRMILFGLAWTAVSINQWLFTTAAAGQILSLSEHLVVRLLAVLLFLVLGSLMLLLPVIIYLVRPEKAQANLEKIDNWLNEAMPIAVLVILFAIGLYFVISGTTGVMSFLTSHRLSISVFTSIWT